MAVCALILQANATLTSNHRYQGDIHMKSRMNRLLTAVVVVLAWSSSAYAGCNNSQFAGSWDIQFSDGNSCRVLVDMSGDVVAEESSCYDPFLGAAPPRSGAFAVAKDCSVNGHIVVPQGITVDLEALIAGGRNVGAGRFLIWNYGVKGAITMIRVE